MYIDGWPLGASIKLSAIDLFSPFFAIESMRIYMKRENTAIQPGLSPGSCKSQCFKVAQPLLNMKIGKIMDSDIQSNPISTPQQSKRA